MLELLPIKSKPNFPSTEGWAKLALVTSIEGRPKLASIGGQPDLASVEGFVKSTSTKD